MQSTVYGRSLPSVEMTNRFLLSYLQNIKKLDSTKTIYLKWQKIKNYMGKPKTPLVGCDVFVVNELNKILLIKRTDNGRWAMPGGCIDLGETPSECAIRECKEETGFDVKLLRLIGTWSSKCYQYVYYPWTDNEFVHLVFEGEVIGGEATLSSESDEIDWFEEDNMPPLSDGHETRIKFGFKSSKNKLDPYFE